MVSPQFLAVHRLGNEGLLSLNLIQGGFHSIPFTVILKSEPQLLGGFS